MSEQLVERVTFPDGMVVETYIIKPDPPKPKPPKPPELHESFGSSSKAPDPVPSSKNPLPTGFSPNRVKAETWVRLQNPS